MSQDEVEGFANWYEKYPRKVARRDAAKAYRREIKTEEDRVLALANLELWKRTEQWQTWAFVPYPATFLNRGQWQERPDVVQPLRNPELYVGRGPELGTSHVKPEALERAKQWRERN